MTTFQSWKLSLIVAGILVQLIMSTTGLTAKAEFEAPSVAIPGQCFMNIGAIVCVSHPPPPIINILSIYPISNATILVPVHSHTPTNSTTR